MRLFGSEKLISMFNSLGVPENRADPAQDAQRCH